MKTIIPSDHIVIKMESMLALAADCTRLKILFLLLNHELNVGEIQVLTKSSQSLVSHQLRLLKDAKLVKSRKISTRVYYSLADDHVTSLLDVVYSHVIEG